MLKMPPAGHALSLGGGLVLLLLFSACGDGRKGSATPEAAMEFSELRSTDFSDFSEEDETLPAEIHGLLEHFSRTADARYATPGRKLTMLHLACMFKKAELARCLLKDGADPNACALNPDEEGTMRPGDNPLTFALTDDGTPCSADVINRLADVLIEGGARLSAPCPDGMPLLCAAATRCEHQEVYIHLLQKGAEPRDHVIPAAAQPAARGWDRALKALADKFPHLLKQGGAMPPLHAAALFVGSGGGADHVACARFLLEQGLPPDNTDEWGRTPLFCAAARLVHVGPDEAALADVTDMLELLLEYGADASRVCQDEEYPGFTAADFIAMCPAVREKLLERGAKLPAPVLSFSSGTALLSEVCKAAMLRADRALITASFDTISGVLTPTPEMESSELYADALSCAVRLMNGVDSERTAAAIEAMPLWLTSPADEAHAPARQAVLNALTEHPGLILSENFLCNMAERLADGGRHDEAALMLELLARLPEEPSALSRYRHSPIPSLRAGAITALLKRAGLPAPQDGSVAEWLSERGLACDNEARRTGVLLTSLEELWYGDMTREKQERLFAAMEKIGARKAAGKYRALAASLQQPEKLDAIMQDVDSWKYELEEAIGQYLITHRKEFLPTASENTD